MGGGLSGGQKQRISAVRHADEILFLENGKIRECGTHEELLAKKGLYYEAYQSQVASVVVIMLVKSPLLALASLSTLPVLIIGLTVIQLFSHKRWRIFRKKASNLNAFIHEDISGIRIIQSFTAEEETKKTFSVLVKEHLSAFKRGVRLNDSFGSIIDICWSVGTIALYYVGLVMLPGSASVGLLISFGYYIGMFWSPIANLSSFYNQLITNIAAAERIFEVLDTEPEIKNSPDAVDISGITGAGKTTIVNLISRFYDATEGEVKIDGLNVKDMTLHSLRSHMGIMTQDNFLFSGTVKENIRYGKLDATEEEIIQAAKAVGAHDFIMKLKDGYDIKLSEQGGGLSVGQKQLLTFARTFVSMPGILILDEATSSIDTKTELLVQKGIETLLKGRTSFVIAHRLSTIQKADRIFVIDEGGIMEQGTAKELLARKGAYYDLYMAQFAV